MLRLVRHVFCYDYYLFTESCDVGALSTSNLPDVLIHLLKESQEQNVDMTEEVLELITDTLLEGSEGGVCNKHLVLCTYLQETHPLTVGSRHFHRKPSFASYLLLLIQSA